MVFAAICVFFCRPTQLLLPAGIGSFSFVVVGEMGLSKGLVCCRRGTWPSLDAAAHSKVNSAVKNVPSLGLQCLYCDHKKLTNKPSALYRLLLSEPGLSKLKTENSQVSVW